MADAVWATSWAASLPDSELGDSRVEEADKEPMGPSERRDRCDIDSAGGAGVTVTVSVVCPSRGLLKRYLGCGHILHHSLQNGNSYSSSTDMAILLFN